MITDGLIRRDQLTELMAFVILPPGGGGVNDRLIVTGEIVLRCFLPFTNEL